MAKTVEVVYDSLIGPIFGPLLKRLGADDVTRRAGLCATQLVGVGVVRYVARAEPIRSMTPKNSPTPSPRPCSATSSATSPDPAPAFPLRAGAVTG